MSRRCGSKAISSFELLSFYFYYYTLSPRQFEYFQSAFGVCVQSVSRIFRRILQWTTEQRFGWGRSTCGLRPLSTTPSQPRLARHSLSVPGSVAGGTGMPLLLGVNAMWVHQFKELEFSLSSIEILDNFRQCTSGSFVALPRGYQCVTQRPASFLEQINSCISITRYQVKKR